MTQTEDLLALDPVPTPGAGPGEAAARRPGPVAVAVTRAAVVLGGLGVATATVVGASWAVTESRAGRVLPGVTVAGVDIGGLDRSAAERRLQPLVADWAGDTALTGPDGRTHLVRAAALGTRLDLPATADRALAVGRGGGLRDRLEAHLRAFLGAQQVTAVVRVDEGAARARVTAVDAAVSRPARSPSVAVDPVVLTVASRPGADGFEVRVDETVRRVLQAQRRRGPERLPLPGTLLPPAVPEEAVAAAVARLRALVAGPYALVTGDMRVELSARQVATTLGTREDGRRLTVAVDEVALQRLVEQVAAPLDVPAYPARLVPAGPVPRFSGSGDLSWSPRPAAVEVVPSRDGRAVDVAAATARFAALLRPGAAGRTATLPLVTVRPSRTTEEVRALGVDSLVGTFTTRYASGQPRGVNIRRIADLVDGTVVEPGGRFSLNGAVGRRTAAKGFVADGAIIDGELEDVIGGGVSQFATTLFNAAFFAGLPIDAHQPHSFWISRYPAGRESTVNFPTIDVVFTNDTKVPLVLRTEHTATSVTVALYGDNGGRAVTADHLPRRPTGDGGFTARVVRVVEMPGERDRRRVFTTRYAPPPDA